MGYFKVLVNVNFKYLDTHLLLGCQKQMMSISGMLYAFKSCIALQLSKFTSCQQNDAAVEETPATKPIVGIIYPPPEVRNIVDKTASFVARLVTSYILIVQSLLPMSFTWNLCLK